MFGCNKSGQVQQIGDTIEFVVDSHSTAERLVKQLQQEQSIDQVNIVQRVIICVNFRERHSDKDKQPVLDLMELSGILYIS